jgi:hypothetical protein
MGDGSELEEMLVQLSKDVFRLAQLKSCPKAILRTAIPVKNIILKNVPTCYYSLSRPSTKTNLFPGQRYIFTKI